MVEPWNYAKWKKLIVLSDSIYMKYPDTKNHWIVNFKAVNFMNYFSIFLKFKLKKKALEKNPETPKAKRGREAELGEMPDKILSMLNIFVFEGSVYEHLLHARHHWGHLEYMSEQRSLPS